MANMLEKKFTNEELGIEMNSYIDNNQNIWFRRKDVAKILGYRNTDDADRSRRQVSTENEITHLIHPKCCPRETQGQQNDTRGKYCTFINEPGFYELVFSSKLEFAKKFRQWVCKCKCKCRD